jgi:hypothetical protein
MYIVESTVEELKEEFPVVEDWISYICFYILNKRKEDCKISIFYHYGFFVPKSKNKGFYQDQYERCSVMLYDERVRYELSKTRVNVTIKIDDFMMTNRIGGIPGVVRAIVSELTKYKMSIECKHHDNKDVSSSIPQFDKTILTVESVKKFVSMSSEDSENEEEHNFDIDDILDKISSDGVEALTKKEKEFLDKKSKDL